jgi:hypothetical protein
MEHQRTLRLQDVPVPQLLLQRQLHLHVLEFSVGQPQTAKAQLGTEPDSRLQI